MASATLTDSTLASSSFCVPNLVHVSRCGGVGLAATVRFNSTAITTRFAIHASSSSCPSEFLEQVSSRGQGVSRRKAVLATFVIAGSLASGVVLPPRSGASEVKQTNLPIEDVKKIIEDDFVSRNYLVTGDMTQSIYNDNCRFQDPTNAVTGSKKYSEALKLLFDPKSSKTELLNIEVSGPSTIDVKYRIAGYLNFPWRPYIAPYEGGEPTIVHDAVRDAFLRILSSTDLHVQRSARYTVGDDGLIESYDEKWSISVVEAFSQFAIPSAFRKDGPTS